jgi:hypothetical protein
VENLRAGLGATANEGVGSVGHATAYSNGADDAGRGLLPLGGARGRGGSGLGGSRGRGGGGRRGGGRRGAVVVGANTGALDGLAACVGAACVVLGRSAYQSAVFVAGRGIQSALGLGSYARRDVGGAGAGGVALGGAEVTVDA